MTKLAGILLVVFGLLMGSWIFYNLFIELTEVAEATAPGPAITLSLGCILLGFYKITNGKLFEMGFWRNREVQKWLSTFLGILFLAYVVNMILRYRHFPAAGVKILMNAAVDVLSLVFIGWFFMLFFLNVLRTKDIRS